LWGVRKEIDRERERKEEARGRGKSKKRDYQLEETVKKLD
jgi:hypothetical protein